MKLTNINKAYGDRKVLTDFNLEIEENTIISIMGPSGCGKTTLLNIIAGLTDFDGQLDSVHEKRGYIFQGHRLIPNITLKKNLDLVIKSLIKDKKERQEKIENILKEVELLDRINDYPTQMSGGMLQRAAMARGFIYPAGLLLMDEPFKGVDVSLKKRLTETFLSLWESNKKTVVFVSHDIDEAIMVSDRIIVLNEKAKIVLDISLETEKRKRFASDEANLVRQKIYSVL